PDADHRLQTMDRCGIRAAALMAAHDYDRPNGQVQTRAMNDFVARSRDANKDRFPVAIGTVEPIQGVDVGLEELARMKNELRLDGVVFHHLYHGTGLADHRTIALVQQAGELGMPVFVHIPFAMTTHATAGS